MAFISRRKMLAGGAVAGTGLAFAQSNAQHSSERKLKVIVAGGHPGDPEYACGGTIAWYTQRRHDVTLLYLNRGQGGIRSKPPEEAGVIRTAEAAKACEILKAKPMYAEQIDGNTIIDNAHYEAFRKIVEAEKPDVLFTQWPIDGHPDHRAISMLSYNAWLRLGKTFAFYYYEVSNGEDTLMFAPTDYVDITAMEPKKRAACYAHASQSPDHFYALQSQVANFRGIESGFTSAEAFVRHAQSPNGLLPDPGTKRQR